MVFSGIRKQRMLGFRFVIQSERPPSYLEERIEAFIVQFKVISLM